MFVDRFSAGLDELKPKDQRDPLKVLAVMAAKGRFSCFEASANQAIARTVTAIMHGSPRWVETYLPDSYKGKSEPGGARAPDQDTYPWTYVRLTEAGRNALKSTSLNLAEQRQERT